MVFDVAPNSMLLFMHNKEKVWIESISLSSVQGLSA
jgi:hypothetical protein